MAANFTEGSGVEFPTLNLFLRGEKEEIPINYWHTSRSENQDETVNSEEVGLALGKLDKIGKHGDKSSSIKIHAN